MEKFFYEMRPYFFIAVGLKAATADGTSLMTVSGVLLTMAAAYVLSCRYKSRLATR